jgi:hypothetical protein
VHDGTVGEDVKAARSALYPLYRWFVSQAYRNVERLELPLIHAVADRLLVDLQDRGTSATVMK